MLMPLTAATVTPAFAGTQIGNQPSPQVCNVYIEYPSHMELRLENATCDQNDNLVGQHSISVTVDLAVRNGVRFTFDSDFLNGRLNGLTSIQTDAGFSFNGEIFPDGRTVGRTTAFDGSVVEGESRGGLANLTATVTRPNGQILYYISGQSVTKESYAQRQTQLASKPPKQSSPVLDMFKRVILRTIADCSTGGCQAEYEQERVRRERKAQERQAAAYQERQARIAEEQRQNSIRRQAENDRYITEQANIRSQQLAAIEDARIKQLAGLDRDGNPVQPPVAPVVIARNDPPPVFVIDTRPPAPTVTTNPPEFSGDVNPQGDPPVITPRPPELPAGLTPLTSSDHQSLRHP